MQSQRVRHDLVTEQQIPNKREFFQANCLLAGTWEGGWWRGDRWSCFCFSCYHTWSDTAVLTGWSLGCRFFPFITINISCHSHLACRVSVEKSAHGLTEVPLYAICFFSLIAFNISSLSLIFDSLITMYLGVFLLVYPFWDSMLPEFGWLFPFPCSGSFQLLSLQMFFSFF